jgi:hypothetical protein
MINFDRIKELKERIETYKTMARSEGPRPSIRQGLSQSEEAYNREYNMLSKDEKKALKKYLAISA